MVQGDRIEGKTILVTGFGMDYKEPSLQEKV